MNISLVVNGIAVEAEGGATFERKDPMTRKVATRAVAALADVEKIVAAAAKAFETWSETGPSARRAGTGRANGGRSAITLCETFWATM
jgi:vanillin dehydrogenase